MTRMKPSDVLHKWKRESAADRIMGCAAMLACHGFMSDSERAKVQVRINKWLLKNGVDVLRRRP